MSTVNPWRLFEVVCVPVGLLASRDLSPGAKLLLGLLFRHAGKNGKCFPSVKTMAAQLGAGHRTIQDQLAELEAARVIEREGHGGAPGTSNNIKFLAFSPWPKVRGVRKSAPVRKTAPGGVRKSARRGAKIRIRKEVLRESSSEEKRESSFHPSSTVTSQQPSEPKKPISLSGDDDDDTGSPLVRLGKWIARRHPEVDANEVAAFVKRDLENVGLLVSETFLNFARGRATGRSTNPVGLYRRLVRDFIAKGRTEAIENQEALMRAIGEGTKAEPIKRQCLLCDDGCLADGGCCTCKVGIVRRELNERSKQGQGVTA